MRLLFDRDADVAAALYKQFKLIPTPYALAVGIIDDEGRLIGGALFQEFNGFNVELAYYGRGSLTRDVVRGLARVCLQKFNPLRVTLRTAKRNKRIVRRVSKFGFKFEGFCPFFYGPRKSDGAAVFGLYRDKLAKLAGN